MTARMSSTKTVMMAIVIILFVAILMSVSGGAGNGQQEVCRVITYEPFPSMSCCSDRYSLRPPARPVESSR